MFISVRWLIKMYPRHTTFRTTFSPSREYDGKVWQAISLTRLVYTRLFDPRFLPELSHRYLSPCVASLFTVWQVGVPRWQRVHVTSYASRGVHRRRWIFERRAERKKGAWYDEARQQRREANLTRFSRANKNGGRGSIMECRKRIYLYLSSILRGNISPVFFPSLSFFFFFFFKELLKKYFNKILKASPVNSRLFFRVEEFFFYYFRFSIFCKVF